VRNFFANRRRIYIEIIYTQIWEFLSGSGRLISYIVAMANGGKTTAISPDITKGKEWYT